MPLRPLALVLVFFAFTSATIAQSPGQTGKPVISGVDSNNQPTLTPSPDLTLLNGNLGVGTTSPAQKLDVFGQVNAAGLCIGGDCRTSWPATGGSSPWTVSGTSIHYGSGNVGIGSSSPAFKLDVVGLMNASGGLCIAGDCKTAWPASTNPWTTSGSDVSFTGGNVGIGTSSANTPLTVATTIDNSNLGAKGLNIQATSNAVAGNIIPITFTAAAGTNRARAGLGLVVGSDWGKGNLAFFTRDASDGSAMSTTDERMRINAAGDVGIGTTAPATRLHVTSPYDTATVLSLVGTNSGSGTGGLYALANLLNTNTSANSVTGLRFQHHNAAGAPRTTGAIESSLSNSTAGSESSWLGFSTTNAGASSEKVRIDNAGNVGIGTASPVTKLDVTGAVRLNGPKSDAPTTFASFADITAKSLLAGGSAYWALREGATAAGSVHFDVYNSGAPKAALSIVQSGNVGIGAVNPTERLHVVGNLKVDGNISALYQDVAEWVEAAAPLADGTVVILDPSRPNVVAQATTAYDTRVAGAVSAQPGVTLGEAAPNKELVAQSGRVRIKVDASYGPIAIGDLLVTSPTAGHAMRSTPIDIGGVQLHRPGTLLGKALESLASGQGEILVLLTLQ